MADWKLAVIPRIGYALIRALHATLRVRHVHPEHIETPPQYIVVFWHAHLLLMLHCRFRKPIVVMSSQHRDAEYIVRVYERYGVECVRGSSTRGGSAALRAFIQKARNGRNLVFTPDGPKGPARIVKEGVIAAARMTGLPLVPVAFAAKKKKLLRSWDRMVVPYPFSKVLFLYGAPMHVPRDGDVEEWREKVERVMNELADEAEKLVEGNDER
ncbi:MAG TPA: lysophospholipid acyltransferase family protein [Thermoanaerobaculia bacterium]|nr:lysophospholipid acyltransferase family protein [Thermoanaerobaculia bacterium]